MNKIHTRIGVLVALALGMSTWLIIGAPGVSSGQTNAIGGPESPEMIAVKFHADWCGYCRAMGPAFIDLSNKFDYKPVLFVKLDFTNSSTSKQAEYLAAALGLDDAWAEYGGKTGFILLIDADTKTVLDKLMSTDDFKTMKAEFQAALAKAQRT